MGLDGAAPLALHSREFGKGPRRALALHCSLAHSGAWKGVAAELEDELTITALDLPGHGRSPDWDHAGDLTAATFEAVLPFLDQPMDLIGHSYGGVIALKLAMARPDLVRSLSLFEPVLMAVAKEDLPEEWEWNRRHMAEVNGHIAAGDPAMGARLFMRVWGDGRKWDDLPEELRQGSTRRIGSIGASQPAISEDNGGVVPRLSEIDAPAVVMDGAESPALMHVVQDGIAARLRNARRVTFDGMAHMGPVTHPKSVAAEIRATLQQA
jgi:pimeloyl-ACP methyl ester carboxylesterase